MTLVDGGQLARFIYEHERPAPDRFDHRFVDGYDAAAMIQGLKECLEHPATIFIDA